MKWALIVFIVHSPSGSVSSETVQFENKKLCERAISSFRYPTSNGFRIITTCVKTKD